MIKIKPKKDFEALAKKKRFVQSLTRSHLSLNDAHFVTPVLNDKGKNTKHQPYESQNTTYKHETTNRQEARSRAPWQYDSSSPQDPSDGVPCTEHPSMETYQQYRQRNILRRYRATHL